MCTHLRPQQGVQEAVLDLKLLGIITAHGSRGEREEGGGKVAIRSGLSLIAVRRNRREREEGSRKVGNISGKSLICRFVALYLRAHAL